MRFTYTLKEIFSHSFIVDGLAKKKRWLFWLLALGISWRVLRWALRMPLWGDEVMLALNFLDRSGIELLEPLTMGQVAPPLFMLLHGWIMHSVGYSEWILRFPALLFGIIGLLLFSWFAFSSIKLNQALIAVAILAVSFYAVRHGSEFKPYSLDLVVAVGLLATAQYFRTHQVSLHNTILLLLVIPLATFFSYPSVFISAAVIISLVMDSVNRKDRHRLLVVGTGTILSSALFFVNYFYIIAPQTQTIYLLQNIWVDSFPPTSALAFLGWVFEQSAGRMMAYPVGDQNYGSVLTLTLCFVGVAYLLGKRHWFLLSVLVLPFIFNIIAAALHIYPYGQRTGFAQHLVPSICLLTGVGLSSLLSWMKRERIEQAHYLALFLFSIIGIAGMVEVVARPYMSHGDLIPRDVVERQMPALGCKTFWVINPPETVPVNFRWYLATQGHTLFGQNRLKTFQSQPETLCILHFDPDRYPSDSFRLETILNELKTEMKLIFDNTDTAYIYSGDMHPHSFRSIVLKR